MFTFQEKLPGRFENIGKDNWNKRTKQVLGVLQESFSLNRNDTLSFEQLSLATRRKTAALCFFEILQLKTWNYIDVCQDRPFADISIRQTVRFSSNSSISNPSDDIFLMIDICRI